MNSFKRAWIIFAVAIFGFAMAAPAQTESGPRLDDPAFFGMLDLDRPDLAAVKSAAGRSDWAAARHALAEEMRTRKTPRWTEGDQGSWFRRGQGSRAADDALAHRFRSIGITWQFGEHIDWKFNPTTAPGSQWPANNEWTWQLNRHEYWPVLANAYRASGDEKYAAEFVRELQSWVHDCPVPLGRPDNKPLSRWRTIEAGIRVGTVWPGVFFGFLHSKSFDDDALVLMLKSFAEHAQYLQKFPTSGNWLEMETNGLYHVGALFPEFKESRLWRETALGRFTHEIDVQVYPDGAQYELAPGYHGVALGNFLGPVHIAKMTGFAPPVDYLAKLERMFDYFLYSMQPTRMTPPLNDSGAGPVTHWMAQGATLYPSRQDFLWVATDGREGKAPSQTSHEFPYAGQFIMRSGWNPDALWLCMEGGPFGYGHQHEDKLGVLITAYGKAMLTEGGVYTYDASEWRRYVLSSRAHNVVLVDGLEQNRRRAPRATYVARQQLPHTWESTAEFDHAAASYDEGWGPRAERIVKQTRHVWFFKKAGCFVIADELAALDGKEHNYEALFHLDAPDAAVDGLRVATQGEGPSLTIFAVGADGARIVKGQKTPTVQGWLPDGSKGYGGIRPIPTAIYNKRAGGKVTMVYVLYPAPAGQPCPLRGVRVNGDKLTLQMADGSEKSLTLTISK